MGFPSVEDNQDGYDNSNLNRLDRARNFNGKNFLLLHGTADGNFSHSFSQTVPFICLLLS